MKQGIDPATHKPFLNYESLIKEEKEKSSMLMPLSQSQRFLATPTMHESSLMSDLNHYNNIVDLAALTEASRKFLMNKPAALDLDPLCYFEFQMDVAPFDYNLSLRNYQPTSLEQNQFGSNSNYFFTSMPCVDSSEFSDNNNNSAFLVNESSSNSSSMSVYQGANEAGFSWKSENKYLDPLLQFQVNAVKSEEFNKTSSWQEGLLLTHNNSIDFNACPLRSLSEDHSTEANFDVFQHL